VIDLIETAVLKHGWTIHVGLRRFRDTADRSFTDNVLSSLRARVPSSRLRFWIMRQPPPAHALVIDDLVFIAGGDWLRSVLQPHQDDLDFGFAVESNELAESLRGCFTGAEEIVANQVNS
jgi:hypothetical protein